MLTFRVPAQGRQSAFHGTTAQQPVLPVDGEGFALRKLMPQGPDHDFNIHVMDFRPGEYLNVKAILTVDFHFCIYASEQCDG